MSNTQSPEHTGNFIEGRWREPESGRLRPNLDPADPARVIGEFAESGAADAELAVDAARRAFPAWRAVGSVRRGEILSTAARLLTERAETISAAITAENGKRLDEARGEVRRAAAILEFTAGEGRRLGGQTLPSEEPNTMAFTWRRPLGVVGLITPWNFPLAIPLWKLAPALLAGCTAVLKPSPLTPLTAALLVEVFAEAGVPEGAVNLVQGDRPVGEALVADPRIAGISFTGSLPVGVAIQQACASRLVRTQLELGGKNAVLVLADADLDAATKAIVHGAFGQSGQRCSATSRVIVDRAVREELLERLLPAVAGMRIGPGTDPESDIGPVIDESAQRRLLAAVERARNEGATVAAGGKPVELPGYYVTPTVLTDLAPDAEIATEEIFGPVLSVVDCSGYEEAMRISNSVRYGMSGTVFTRDYGLAMRALDEFEAGMLHVNRPGVGAQAHHPHMGAKLSQYGAPECAQQVWDFYTEWRSACVSF
ncbi:aldehyde dehydrogenase family protein [Sciscionella marina]|uniref:aldehyde dehydrogenase family protein n=1 Tax=Sciscionella marina TaxID=508770 RepID=UPI00037229EB|nr:aldehyde dehydrogenase family protein [Sciscionella marina]